MLEKLEEMIESVMEHIKSKPELKQYVDTTLTCPKPHLGSSEIKLVVLGQDPTVKDKDSRKNINTVLNLDKNNSLKKYLIFICERLDISLENIYATNLIKNFFNEPPASDDKLISDFTMLWLGVLNWELSNFPSAPVLTLGEPVLQSITTIGPDKVRDYWGYNIDFQGSSSKKFSHVPSSKNILGRRIFTYPHQPSITKSFYKDNMEYYINYTKKEIMLS